jgi:hypothetical protein
MKLRMPHLVGMLLLLVASGLVHGMWTQRWSGDGTPKVGADLLSKLEPLVGEWRTGETLVINPADVPAKAQTHSRRFIHERTGKSATVSLTSGIPGVVAVHTPDVCFLGSGYSLKAGPFRQQADAATFWYADFQKTRASEIETIRVRWAWCADGTWKAPDMPRFVFARAPVLYKLYVVQTLDEEDRTEGDPYRTLAGELASMLSRQVRAAQP